MQLCLDESKRKNDLVQFTATNNDEELSEIAILANVDDRVQCNFERYFPELGSNTGYFIIPRLLPELAVTPASISQLTRKDRLGSCLVSHHCEKS